MKILICGGREWKNRDMIKDFLLTLSRDTVIIEGECRGADRIAREEAEKLGMSVEKYPANWDKYGKGAGHIRNKEMLDKGKPDMVIAFHNNIDESKGTKNMITRAARENITYMVLDGTQRLLLE